MPWGTYLFDTKLAKLRMLHASIARRKGKRSLSMQRRACSAKEHLQTSFMLSMSRARETSSKHAYDSKSGGCCMSVPSPRSVYQTSPSSRQRKISDSTSIVRAFTITYPSTRPKRRLQKESHRDLML